MSFSIRNESNVYKKKSLAHGQVPTKFSLARLEKPLAPGVGQWDLSAPGQYFIQDCKCRIQIKIYTILTSQTVQCQRVSTWALQ